MAGEREKSLLVWGSGGHGRVVADMARAAGYTVVGYIDAAPEKYRQVVDAAGGAVIANEDELRAALKGDTMIPGNAKSVALGIGDNQTRLRCAEILGPLCASAIVHPRAIVSHSVSLADGVVVFANAVINTDANIAFASIINTGAIIEHDVRIGNGAHISPGAILTGNVNVGDLAWIGAGATIIPSISIGANTIVGAGSVVIRSVPDNTKVVGNPARIIP